MREYLVLIFPSLSEIGPDDIDGGRIVKALDERDAAENAFAEWNSWYTTKVHYALVQDVDGGEWKKFEVYGEPDWRTCSREIE